MEEIKGIVLDTIDYKEKSKIVYLYTPYGIESVKANSSKDIKKGLLGFITTLNEVNYIRTQAKFPTMVEYTLINSNYHLTKSYEIMECVGSIIQVLKNIPTDSDHPRIFEFVLQMLHQIQKENCKKILAIFLIKMLYVFGVTPRLKECIRCNQKNFLNFFSIFDGGAICNTCKQNKDKETHHIWKEYYYEKKDVNLYSQVDFESFLKDIYEYYSIHVHLNL